MEGDAGASRLNPITTTTESHLDSLETASIDHDESTEPTDTEGHVVEPRRVEHLGRSWFVGLCALFVILAAAIAGGGYLALTAHRATTVVDRAEIVALARAKECVAATQAPDIAAITASETKIIECGTGAFAVQSSLYAGLLVDAYQAANVSVKVSDLRAAVERVNPDQSVDVLVALRVQVTNSQAANQEQGYRLRVQMAPADGTYKIAKLDQVAS